MVLWDRMEFLWLGGKKQQRVNSYIALDKVPPRPLNKLWSKSLTFQRNSLEMWGTLGSQPVARVRKGQENDLRQDQVYCHFIGPTHLKTPKTPPSNLLGIPIVLALCSRPHGPTLISGHTPDQTPTFSHRFQSLKHASDRSPGHF